MIIKSKTGKRKIETTFLGAISAPKVRPNDDEAESPLHVAEKSFPSTSLTSCDAFFKAKDNKVEEYEVVALTDRPIVEAVPEKLNIKAPKTGKVHIAAPKVKNILSVKLRNNAKNINVIQSHNQELRLAEGTTLKALRNEAVVWSNFILEPVVLLAANELYSAVLTNCQSLHVYNTSTGLKLMDWTLEKQTSLITLNCDYLLLVTTDLDVIIINLEAQKVASKLSFASLLYNKGISLVGVALTDHGVPLAALSNGESMYYDVDNQVWISIETGTDSLVSMDTYLDVVKKSVPYGIVNVLFPLSKPYKKAGLALAGAKRVDEENALEVLINALIVLESPEELRLVLILFVQRLLVMGRYARLGVSAERMANRRTKAAGGGRRKYTEGMAAQCSVDKHGGAATEKRMTTIPAKFVHRGKSEVSEHSKPMNAKQVVVKEWITKILSGGLRELRHQFVNKVKKYTPSGSTDAFNDADNNNKNRYDDVVLLDKTRVKVTINPDNDDYIHASTVEVKPKDLSYICAQGPMENTVMQFWLMCIQEEVAVVLQLCANTEKGKEKCSDYMPKEKGESATYGVVEVKLVDQKKNIPGAKKVVRSKLQVTFKEKTSTVTHILYTGWPDHSVPESVGTCREVRNMVHKLYEKKPIVVHCSAGIGRTGTFVAAEMVLSKLVDDQNSDFNLADILRTLRDQRVQAVQNDQQFTFILRFVIDILITEDLLSKTSKVSEFLTEFEDLVERKKKLEKQKDD
ncbi:unnamed protein product [Bursaphelenchus okinawaensis]|uniref:Tyrosine-protein phosphatase domain-containing protein n=1 Tax=Bursaphelenchus okinawaensis TaxID=465554 RepID=A0A811KTA3_9BILA|nr:unnamed protein product [Bursaphelenchus okinawaensis]CAG9111313.1 unnamed protein product [Bursaphelenchus okinawaensis]